MNSRFAHCCAAWLLLASVSAQGREIGKKAAGDWERSLVTVEINRKQYDYFQPWTKRVQTVSKAGLVIGPREILTTADDLADRTLVRLQKGGRGKWWNAAVKWVDYPANIAVVTSSDEKFWSDLKAARWRIPSRNTRTSRSFDGERGILKCARRSSAVSRSVIPT